MNTFWNKIPWNTFPCSKNELRLDITLKCGQSFRWSESDESCWTGAWRNKIWTLKQDSDSIYFKAYPYSKGEVLENSQQLQDYFQLNVKLDPLYKEWSKVDKQFSKVAKHYPGVRMLRQDPVENVFSFICSSNNNIKRISSMVEHMSTEYGSYLGSINDKDYHSFPTVEQLNKDKKIEENLRSNGFGYRAGYIVKTAKKLLKNGSEDSLLKLRELSYQDAKEQLIQLPGVGPKVADCILLMSLDKAGAIPVDTHMFQIAARYYLPHLVGKKSVNSKIYLEIGDYFRDLFGDYAGWAHSVLFSADLKHLQGMKNKDDIEGKPPTKKARKQKPA
ncbi:N-glycosylase/DNA lyase [Lepeophtheirus salmonis]|uniref:N-glycosylase/DNA lyase n=1 Tax=Lepeophtheirus salmonis TaxID=72036 RepID=UPI001AE3562A|nr:N-glycosylase/DNA lyase-like [Lepeophtheirus salmonis]